MIRVFWLAAALALLPARPSFAALWPELSSLPSEQGGGEADAAVIVGIELYPFVAPVPGAAQNAEDWHLYLTKTRKVPVGQVKLLRDSEASLEDIRDAAAWAAATVKPGGTLWFVFIGHGAPHKDGQDGVLIGVDAQQRAESLYHRSLRRSELMSILGKGKQESSVVVLDACFSGRTAEGKELVKGLQPLIAVAAADAWPKAAVFTAARSDQFAGPLPGASRPAFSYLMLGALRGWADADKDGMVTSQEALTYTQSSLEALLKDRRQTPELLGALPGSLSRGAREAGPDVGAIVRAVRPKDASELAFGGAASVTAPVMKVAVAEGSFKDADIAVERMLEDAMLREKDAAYLPVEKLQAWCLLAGAPANKHPYRAQAIEACGAWMDFVKKSHEQELNLLSDYAALAGYLSLRLKTPGQKAAAIAAYLAAYEPLKGHSAVAAVLKAREALAAGQPVALPSMDDQGPPARPRKAEVPEAIKDLAFVAPASSYAFQMEMCQRNGGSYCETYFKLFYNQFMTDEGYCRREVALGLFVCLGGTADAADACSKAGAQYDAVGFPKSEAAAAVAFTHGCLMLRDHNSCVAAAKASEKAANQSSLGTLLREASCLRGNARYCSFAGKSLVKPGAALADLRRAKFLFTKGCRQKDEGACADLSLLKPRLSEAEMSPGNK
ncbi:MAG: hypothetical protein COV48_16190 [Elusimicrobia bacterium CG11_big_fil_rev_8_21_14_0_20_64_6]|nr:MAG: hypothetical protein COV48_16190 [Elusimicrobia bacterium CG11_big_fil_rev_8_21_14_0_20_64_6]